MSYFEDQMELAEELGIVYDGSVESDELVYEEAFAQLAEPVKLYIDDLEEDDDERD